MLAAQRRNDKIHAEALRNYRFDFDDDVDTSEMSEEALGKRTFQNYIRP